MQPVISRRSWQLIFPRRIALLACGVVLLLRCDDQVAAAKPWVVYVTAVWGQQSELDMVDREEEPLDKPGANENGQGKSQLDEVDEDQTEPEEVEVEDRNLDDEEDELFEVKMPFYDIVYYRHILPGEKLGEGVYPFKGLAEQYVPTKESGARSPNTEYQFRRYRNKMVLSTYLVLKGKRIDGNVRYFEEERLIRAGEELDIHQAEQLVRGALKLDLSDITGRDAAQKAIEILTQAIASHDSAVQRKLRQGRGWHLVRDRLVTALFNIELSRFRYLVEQNRLDAANSQCEKLSNLFTLLSSDKPRWTLRAMQQASGRVFLVPARREFEAGNYRQARELRHDFARRFPNDRKDSEAEKLRQDMVNKAKTELAKASTTRDHRARLALITQAESIWPELPELAEARRQIQASYPILKCAYAVIPERFSPFAAESPSERHAVSLIYESLVHWRFDEAAGGHYHCQLAKGRPLPQARGRDFRLPLCSWDGPNDDAPRPLTAEDVRRTVLLIKTINPVGYTQEWERLIANADAKNNDPRLVKIRLTRDYWQPLSLMDFPIVSTAGFENLKSKEQCELDAAKLNERPVGTGPYRLESKDASTIRFTANPSYRKSDLPRIREISFYQVDSEAAPAKFDAGEIHMYYGLRSEHLDQLNRLGFAIGGNLRRIRTPTVYFLAPNHNRKKLKNENLRLAIAHAIDRRKILDQYCPRVREGKDHAVLTGPFPQGSWAEDPSVSGFGRDKAAAYAAGAMKELGGGNWKLQLAYPDRDLEVEQACSEMKKQIEDTLRQVEVTIDLVPVEPGRYRATIESGNGFDLAYWRHDYRDEAYWPQSLFDPNDTRTNVMNYVPDRDMRQLLYDLKIHKRFGQIQKTMHGIHKHVNKKAILIPLWQLDTYVAIRNVDTKRRKLDPFNIFRGVEQWTLNVD